MAAVSVRVADSMRKAATWFGASFVLSFATMMCGAGAAAQAGPLAVSLVNLGALGPQLEAPPPSFGVSSASLSRHARLERLRSHRRHGRASRIARIRQARAEFALMSRRGAEFCLATAVYFEARDEPIKGQRAVAAVILDRVRTPGRPKTICGVVFEGSWRKTGCQFSFACDGRPDVPHWRSRWLRAQRSAAYVLHHRDSCRMVRGATFYHTKFVHPRWDRHMVRVARIGLHVFYRPRRGHYS